MKIRVNKEIIKELIPCQDGWENYLRYHSDFSGDITEFLNLENITPQDKIWVSTSLMPRVLAEIFAQDCAYTAYAYAADAYAAAYAADAERSRQLDAIAYLVSTWDEGEL